VVLQDKINSNKKYILIVLFFIASIALYERSFFNKFVWDSNLVITQDPDIRDYRRVPDYFRHHYFENTATEGAERRMLYYRPVLKTINMLEYSIFEQNPVGYNIVNILLNALVVVLIFQLVQAISGNVSVAAISALLFMVNPSHVEAVSWVYSDSYIIAALFCLGSLYSYHSNRYLLSSLLLVPALLTHEQSIQMIFALALYEMTIRRESFRGALVRLAPCALMIAAYLVVRSMVISGNVYQGVPVANPLGTAVIVMQRYARIFFVPDALITLYPLGTFKYSMPELLVSVLFCILTVGGIVLLVKKGWYHELFWIGWFFVWLMVPVAAIVRGRLGDFLMADKLLYIPSLGLCVAIASLVMKALDRKTVAVCLLVGAISVFHGAYSFARTGYWQSNRGYFEKAYEFEPDFPLLTYSLGLEYAQDGMFDKARQLFLRTIALNPLHTMAFCNLGNIYYQNGDIPNAINAWDNALRADRTNPMPYYNLGMLKERDGNIEGALQMYRRYLALTTQAPEDIRARIQMLETSTKGGGR
jgi:hypothetical protein